MISVRNDQDVGDTFYDRRKLRISPQLIICCPGFQNHLNLREKVHWKETTFVCDAVLLVNTFSCLELRLCVPCPEVKSIVGLRLRALRCRYERLGVESLIS
jgi:hypothetical protein